MGEIINVLVGKRYVGKPEEFLPADSLYPLAHPFPFPGVGGIDLDNVLDGANQFWPARWIVRDKGNSQPGEHRGASGIGDLAPDKYSKTITFGVGNRHGRANGEAIGTIHASFFDDDEAFYIGVRMAPDSPGGTGCHGGWYLTRHA